MDIQTLRLCNTILFLVPCITHTLTNLSLFNVNITSFNDQYKQSNLFVLKYIPTFEINLYHNPPISTIIIEGKKIEMSRVSTKT